MGSFARVILFDKRSWASTGTRARTRWRTLWTTRWPSSMTWMSSQAAIFGISEGGSAATMLAAAHPDRVSAMVQYGTYAHLVQAENDQPEGIPFDRLKAFWSRDRGSLGRSVQHRLLGPESRWRPPNSTTGGVGSFALASAHAVPGGLRHVPASRRPSAAGECQRAVPDPVPRRRQDHPACLSHAVAPGIPDAREVELRGRDHLFCTGDQDALLDEIERFLTGDLTHRPVDRVLATVLFTDIVGSTERAVALGDRRWQEGSRAPRPTRGAGSR